MKTYLGDIVVYTCDKYIKFYYIFTNTNNFKN